MLASHIHHIYPNERQPWIAQASEANLIAIINFDIACEQSKRKQIKAASDIIRLRVSRHDNCLVTYIAIPPIP